MQSMLDPRAMSFTSGVIWLPTLSRFFAHRMGEGRRRLSGEQMSRRDKEMLDDITVLGRISALNDREHGAEGFAKVWQAQAEMWQPSPTAFTPRQLDMSRRAKREIFEILFGALVDLEGDWKPLLSLLCFMNALADAMGMSLAQQIDKYGYGKEI